MSNLFLQRDTKLYVEMTDAASTPAVTGVFEIPILEGFSFSQATNVNEVTLSEASPDGIISRRGTARFTDSLAPAEFSFQTYLRPFKSAGSDTNGSADRNAASHHSVEEVLWALFAGAHAYRATATSGTVEPLFYGKNASGLAVTNDIIAINSTTDASVKFDHINQLQMGSSDFYFVMQEGSDSIVYKLDKAVLNEVSVDFDIDGIATCSWSGFAKAIVDVNLGSTSTTDGRPSWMSSTAVVAASATVVTEGQFATNNFIQNRLSTVTIANNSGDDPNTNYLDSYTVTLTGGSITLSNNITYITPNQMGVVNQPLGHYTGAFSTSGTLTCYLDHSTGRSADLFEDLAESSVFDVTNFFTLGITLGGKSTETTVPTAQFAIPAAHLEIPSHAIDEVIGMEINFHALPHTGSAGSFVQDITGMNDLSIRLRGVTPDSNVTTS